MTAITLQYFDTFLGNFPSCVVCPAENVEEISSLFYGGPNYTAQLFCDCTLR
jgi:hypothetical protein